VSEEDDLLEGGAAGPPSSSATEDVLHEAEARLLAASLGGIAINQQWHWAPQNGKLHVHDSSPAAVQPVAMPELPEPELERNSAQNGANGSQLTFKGIVFDLETTGAVH
jgi:hypothetical protein